nr:hypothetical protein [Rhodococcus sp. B7740]
MAWVRTESAVAVCAVIGIRLSAHTRQPALIALAVLVGFGSAALLASGWIARVRAGRTAEDTRVVFPWRAHAIAVLIPTLGMFALSFVIWSASSS